MYSEHPTDLLPPPGGGGTAGGRPVRLVLLFGEGEAAGESPADLSLLSGSVRAAGESPVRLVSLFGESEVAGASPADLLPPSGGSRAAGESPAEKNPRITEKPFSRLRAWAKAHPGETLAIFSQDLFVQSRSPSAQRRSKRSESILQSGFVRDLGSDSAADVVLARTSQYSAENGTA